MKGRLVSEEKSDFKQCEMKGRKRLLFHENVEQNAEVYFLCGE